jgi:hypothetical protein
MGLGALFRGNALVYAVNRALNPALHRIHPESRYSIAIVGFWLYSSLFATKRFFHESALFPLYLGIPKG